MQAGKSAIWPCLICQYNNNMPMDLPSSVQCDENFNHFQLCGSIVMKQRVSSKNTKLAVFPDIFLKSGFQSDYCTQVRSFVDQKFSALERCLFFSLNLAKRKTRCDLTKKKQQKNQIQTLTNGDGRKYSSFQNPKLFLSQSF